MYQALFCSISNKDKSTAIETLIARSSPSYDFFLFVILSVLMATLGFWLNSAAIIIGSMLIAPILYPLLSLSMGIVMSDKKLITNSLSTLLRVIFFAIFSSAIVTLLFSGNGELTPEIIARSQPSLIDAAVAVIAGLAVVFATAKPQLNETLPGIAVSVALVPPLAVVGIGIVTLNWPLTRGSFLLFLVNALGIIFTSVIVFSIMNFYTKRKEAMEAVKKEQKILEKQQKETNSHNA